jgi:hypothetical protein
MFHDDKSQYSWIYGMKGKSPTEMFEKFMDFISKMENKSGKCIKILRANGGGEYQKDFAAYLKKEGIVHETTAPCAPEQNGVSEHANHTLFKRVQVILTEANLPKNL